MKATNKEFKEIIQKIVDGYHPEKIWLFGSYSRNTQTDSSDIDLLIIKKTNTRAIKRPAEVQKIFKPYIFDLDILVYTPEEFDVQKDSINSIAYFVNKEGKLIYEQSI
jgi:uncharacterized protein